MANPFSKAAKESHKSKLKSMGKTNNLDIPVMRAAGENKAGGVHESSAHGQHQKQAAAPGMASGGRAYPLQRGGGDSGVGRLEKIHSGAFVKGKLKPIK